MNSTIDVPPRERIIQTREPSTPDLLLDIRGAADGQHSPRLPDGHTEHMTLQWGNLKQPTKSEWNTILAFGRYPDFDPKLGKLSKRLRLQVADLRVATQIIIVYHYLHRGRTMAQLPYWINIDRIPIGVMLFSLPRLSVPIDGIAPMNVLELARLWISPDVQEKQTLDSQGRAHSLAVATCALGAALRVVQKDWRTKYPTMPDIRAVVSWADSVRHEGTIYRAANFMATGISGGSLHGNASRVNGGRDQANADYLNKKTRFLYRFTNQNETSASQLQLPLATTRDAM